MELHELRLKSSNRFLVEADLFSFAAPSMFLCDSVCDLQAAQIFRDEISFAVASSKDEEGLQIMKQFGLAEQNLPALLV